MVRGIFHSWKQPIFYEFDQNMTKAVLFSIIKRLETIGIQMWGITCDEGPSNMGLLGCLHVSTDSVSFENPSDSSQQVWVFPDAPHLLKLMRNHILASGITIKPGVQISQEDFEAVRQADNRENSKCTTNLRMATF